MSRGEVERWARHSAVGSGTRFRRKSGDASQLCNLLQVPHDDIPLSGSGPGLLLFTQQHLVNPGELIFLCFYMLSLKQVH